MDHLDKYIGPEPHPHMSDVLLRRCGLNHLGFPIWRMVRSEYVVEKVGGRWSEWNDDLSVADRGGITTGDDGKPTETAYRPDRIVFDVRETQAYSHFDNHGWLLQRWYPASFFGSPQSWAESVVMDMDANGHLTIPTNIPILGPYPSEGRYIEQYGPVDKEPSVSFIIDFIADWEARRDAFPDNVQEHIRMRVELAMKHEEERADRAMRENEMRLMESVRPITSTTLEAGRWRSRQFEKAGFTSHIGN